jgi:rubrerythrin
MYVVNFALEMEKVGKEYFKKLATETSLTGVKNIFSMMAAEQQELIDSFNSIQSKVKSPLLVDSEALENAINIFTQIFNESTIGILRNDLDAYRHAMKIEDEIVKFFIQMAQLETNKEAKALLFEIAEEEKRLYNSIEDIHDFVAAPKTHLEMLESSHLKDMF